MGQVFHRGSHKLVWNRTCNQNDGDENNIPLDLEKEHLNGEFKYLQSEHRRENIARSSQATDPLKSMIKSRDKTTESQVTWWINDISTVTALYRILQVGNLENLAKTMLVGSV